MEEWLDIKGWEGFYCVSDRGRVESVHRVVLRSNGILSTVKSRILKPGGRKSGRDYLTVGLVREGGRPRYFLVHRLVAQAFIPNPENKPEVNHRDLNRCNNLRTNLEWATKSENDQHAREMQAFAKGSHHYRTQLTESDVPIIRRRLAQGEAVVSIARAYGIKCSAISNIKRGLTWKHV